MEILAIFILGFLSLRTIISLVNLLSGLHLPDKKSLVFPKVSILIPARDEESTVGKLLENIQKQDYPDFEVLVCNDHSSDNTEEILNWFAGEDERIRWFLGEKLPADWLGKNFACHQLAQKASGNYLIFMDADVELSADAISKAVAFFQEKQLSLLSIFPQQKMDFCRVAHCSGDELDFTKFASDDFGAENQFPIVVGSQRTIHDVRSRKLSDQSVAFESQESKCGRHSSRPNDQSFRIENGCFAR